MKIIIIGSGVCGSGIARELSCLNCEILVLEKGNDISVGTSKANSGIVHAGFDAKSKSNKAKFNVIGNRMFDQLSRDLDFPFRRNGSLVLCFNEAGKNDLINLLEKGKVNGVPDLEILSGEQARAIEPNISKNVAGALYAKTSGIVSPYEMNIALAENAAANGTKFLFNQKVISIENINNRFEVKTKSGETFIADAVVNAAGVFADTINNMVCNKKLKITAVKGDYVLMDKSVGDLCDKTLFQLPSKLGKGILIAPTTHKNILVGPTATDVDDKESVSTKIEDLNTLFEKALLTMPGLNKRNIITQFSGLRAHEAGDDFVVGESEIEGFFNVAGIESPGLTAAPAIAVEIANLIAKKYNLSKKENFIKTRKGIPCFAKLTNEERQKLIDINPLYGKIVCRCEVVTEGEIIDSIRRPLGATDLDGVKRRTRSGMGRCQMSFCTPRILEILAEELKVDLTEITKCGGNSKVVAGRTK